MAGIKTNKYFTFNHVIDNDNIIIITGNVKIVKDSYVLVIGSNKAVFLKPWQVKEVHNFYSGYSGYAVKLNRNYFKPFRGRVESISKEGNSYNEWLSFKLINDQIALPFFKSGRMYKNMERGKGYTLKELGL